MAAGAFVPIDVTHPVQRILWMLEDTCAPVVLLADDMRAMLPSAYVGKALLLEGPELSHQGTTPPGVSSIQSQAMVIIFTSGSTGRPKGALLEHKGSINLAHIFIEMWEIGTGDRIFQWSSPAFDVSFWDYMLASLSGARLLLWDGHWQDSLRNR